jgi:hypothetical protein
MTREEMKSFAEWAAREAVVASSPAMRDQLLKLHRSLVVLSRDTDDEVQSIAERIADIRPAGH